MLAGATPLFPELKFVCFSRFSVKLSCGLSVRRCYVLTRARASRAGIAIRPRRTGAQAFRPCGGVRVGELSPVRHADARAVPVFRHEKMTVLRSWLRFILFSLSTVALCGFVEQSDVVRIAFVFRLRFYFCFYGLSAVHFYVRSDD